MTERKYAVIVYDKKEKPVKQIYTDKLSDDGKIIHTYRPDGTLCLKKGFTNKGEYVMIKYDNSGKKEEYRVTGGLPDSEAARLFFQCQKDRKKVTVPFCHRLLHTRQRY